MNTNDVSACAVVIDLHAKSCAELFTVYGLTAHLRRDTSGARSPARPSYVSVLSASGDGIRLCSTVSMDRDLLALTHPSGSEQAREHDVQDWCRELNNQLMGRVKNKLLRIGCEIATGLPVLVSGTGVSVVVPPDVDSRQYCFTSEHGNMTFTLEMLFMPSFAFRDAAELVAGEEVKREGELSLFF
jgi:hypothetical protein